MESLLNSLQEYNSQFSSQTKDAPMYPDPYVIFLCELYQIVSIHSWMRGKHLRTPTHKTYSVSNLVMPKQNS